MVANNRGGQIIHRNRSSRWAVIGVVFLILSSALSACQSGDQSTSVQDTTVVGGATPSAKQGLTPAPGGLQMSTPDPAATGTANVDVSPNEVAMGNVVITLSVQPAQSVFDPARAAANSTGGDQQQSDQQKNAAQQKGYAVLGGSGIKITNNFDGAQSPPADQPREVLRHVAVQIRDKASGQLIPYVGVSMDLLREGRPTLQDQPLIPMVQPDGGVSQMHYGNNVEFPGRGEYQIFVRMEPSPLLGSGSLGVAQFNVSIK